MDFRYCQCAFHNKWCDVLGTTSNAAAGYVHQEWWTWTKEKMKSFAESCIDNDNAIWNRPTRSCIYCHDGYEVRGARCIEEGNAQSIEELYNLPERPAQVGWSTDQPSNAKIVATEGDVFVYMSAFNKWRGPVRSGQPMYPGDILLTRDRGAAKVTLFNQEGETTIDISPDTRLELPRKKEAEPETWTGYLQEGAVRIYNAIVDGEEEPSPTAFNVRTPTISTGRRGTDYILAHKDGVSTVVLHEGAVDVSQLEGDSFATQLQPGQEARFDGQLIIEESQDFAAVLEQYGLDQEKYQSSAQDVTPLTHVPIDPDQVYPVDIAYTGELVGDIEYEEKGSSALLWIGLVLILGGVGFLAYKKQQDS